MESLIGAIGVGVAVALVAFLLSRAQERSRSTPAPSVDAEPAASRTSEALALRPISTAELPKLGRTPFTIVDLETTGLHPVPDGEHRIVEVSIIRTAPDGTIAEEWATLINPQRRMGATRIHGITAAEVQNAPTFADVAGDIAERLAGAVVVAHNAPFDLRFLAGEFEAIGVPFPQPPSLCTLDLAYRLTNLPCRKLGFLCDEFGIEIDEHAALGDARAVAKLLARFLDDARAGGSAIPYPEVPVLRSGWAGRAPSGRSICRANRSGAREDALVAKRSVRAPIRIGEQQYFDAVELATSDGVLTADEFATLTSLAQHVGCPRRELDLKFLRTLAEGARADGVVTPQECMQVLSVAELLQVPTPEVVSLLAESAPAQPPRIGSGSSVCLLGYFDPGAMATVLEVIRARGLTLRKNLTASVDLVVVETTASDTKRQARAKGLGIPVLTADQFLRVAEGREGHVPEKVGA